MNIPSNVAASPLRQQAANTLLRARKLPPGPYRSDLRQLGVGLLSLYKKGFRANVRISDENAIDRSRSLQQGERV